MTDWIAFLADLCRVSALITAAVLTPIAVRQWGRGDERAKTTATFAILALVWAS